MAQKRLTLSLVTASGDVLIEESIVIDTNEQITVSVGN
jgi:hypothetical protein